MMSLAVAARALDSTYVGNDLEFNGVSTDTRSIRRGEMFVALKGPNYDGHQFVSEAYKAGAATALVSCVTDVVLPYIRVPDTRIALGDLAAYWRQRFQIPFIAVTGSNGKTTVKEMIASIMRQRAKGVATRGNLNNDIGVPLTLLRLRTGDQYAVVEMGMNHMGEIHRLTLITRPTVAVITNAAEAHLQGLGSVEAVARAKGEIFDGLPENGVAVINADDAYMALWKQAAAGRRCVTFGLSREADVAGYYQLDSNGSLLRIKTSEGDIDMRLPLPGKHNIMNAMAAASSSLAAGASLEEVKTGLEKLKAISGRMETKKGVNGTCIIDDTYNANPASVAAGLEVLKQANGERVLVLGDMGELGDTAPDIHQRVGELAKKIGVDRIFAVGELTVRTVAGFGRGAKHYDTPESLTEDLIKCSHADMTILVKGSRIMKMERIVEDLTATTDEAVGG